MTQFSQEAPHGWAISECTDPVAVFEARRGELYGYMAQIARSAPSNDDFVEEVYQRSNVLVDDFQGAVTTLFAESTTPAEAVQGTATLWHSDERDRRQQMATMLHQEWMVRPRVEITTITTDIYIESTDQAARTKAIRDSYALELQSDLLPFIEHVQRRQNSASTLGELGGTLVSYGTALVVGEFMTRFALLFGQRKKS